MRERDLPDRRAQEYRYHARSRPENARKKGPLENFVKSLVGVESRARVQPRASASTPPAPSCIVAVFEPESG